jgi:hypothetical protein
MIPYDLKRTHFQTTLITSAQYTVIGEQVMYTYSPILLEPPLLLEAYGLAFPNNAFA